MNDLDDLDDLLGNIGNNKASKKVKFEKFNIIQNNIDPWGGNPKSTNQPTRDDDDPWATSNIPARVNLQNKNSSSLNSHQLYEGGHSLNSVQDYASLSDFEKLII